MEIYLDVEVAHLNCTKQGLSSSTFWLGKCFDVTQVHNTTFPVGFWIPIIWIIIVLMQEQVKKAFGIKNCTDMSLFE